MSMDKNYDIDFCWSSQKEYFSLKPLFIESKKMGINSRFIKIHKSKLLNYFKFSNLSKTIVISHDQSLKRAKKIGWKGAYIYIEHGLGAMKYYTYKYSFFHDADLLFYPGEIFKKKMESINPNFKNGLLGGYPKMDELYSLKINRNKLARKYGLNPEKPIKLFAPSWGGKYSKKYGINNIKFFKDVDNLLVVPHPADYKIARKYNVVIPKKDENINQFIHLADVVISEVSSVIAEASLLNKPVIQLLLDQYPGCFPEKDKRKNEDWIKKEILEKEINFDRKNRPFKIPFVDEDWIMGHICIPENVNETIEMALNDPYKHEQKRNYWSTQSCYKFDGKISRRINKMINEFIVSGKRIQL